MLQLQSNVPLPDGSKARGPRKKYPVERMAIGDFFFVPNKRYGSIRTYFSTLGTQHGIKLKSEQIHAKRNEDGAWVQVPADTTGAVMGVGVWRTE
jgi:hypothetical protein